MYVRQNYKMYISFINLYLFLTKHIQMIYNNISKYSEYQNSTGKIRVRSEMVKNNL